LCRRRRAPHRHSLLPRLDRRNRLATADHDDDQHHDDFDHARMRFPLLPHVRRGLSFGQFVHCGLRRVLWRILPMPARCSRVLARRGAHDLRDPRRWLRGPAHMLRANLDVSHVHGKRTAGTGLSGVQKTLLDLPPDGLLPGSHNHAVWQYVPIQWWILPGGTSLHDFGRVRRRLRLRMRLGSHLLRRLRGFVSKRVRMRIGRPVLRVRWRLDRDFQRGIREANAVNLSHKAD
jgi:hypothetical protein